MRRVLYLLRNEKGLTLKEVSISSGIGYHKLRRLELGQTAYLSPEQLMSLLAVYGLHIDLVECRDV